MQLGRARRSSPTWMVACCAVALAACGGSGTSGGAAGTTGGTSEAGTTGAAAGTTGRGGTTGTAGTSGGTASGCGVSGAATGVTNGQIQVGTQMRTFVLFVPTGYNPATAYPLIFAWHGLGGTGMLARQYFRIEQAAANQAIFVYPDGLPIASQQNMAGWDLTANGVDVQLFDALVAQLSAGYCINPNRIFSAGHSFGAFFSNRLACARGNVLRAIGPVAGAPPNGTCTGQVAAWIAHGMADPTVAFTNGEATRDFWSRANGCTATMTTPTPPDPCVALQGCMADLPVHWCAHTGMHEWPSFAGSGIWNFFATFQ